MTLPKTVVAAMKSSMNSAFETRPELLAHLFRAFHFDLDVCAERANVADVFYSSDDDGLSSPWYGLRWMNPPYGRQIHKWITRAVEESDNGATVCLILPARTDTKWFQYGFRNSDFTVFVKGRLTFGSDEFWIRKYALQIVDALAEQDSKKFEKVAGLVGGVHITPSIRNLIWKSFMDGNLNGVDLNRWFELDHLRLQAALFPSAFLVFGEISEEQKENLSALGTPASVINGVRPKLLATLR